MGRHIYTVGGHLATLYNNTTGLSGIEVTDPDIILRYYTHDTTQTGARYDGITYEGRLVDTTNACYYSTQLYAKPKLSDLTAAQFVSASELTAYGTFPQGGNYRTDGTYYFPYDVSPVGCYVIPKSAYSGDKELYVYIWLPSIESNPVDDDATYPDATMLAMESVGMDIIRCRVKNGGASWMFNQTYISSMSGVNIASQDLNFGVGEVYPDASSYPPIIIRDSNIPNLNPYDNPSVFYQYVDNCSGTLFTQDFKHTDYTPDILNSNIAIEHDHPDKDITLSATTATIYTHDDRLNINASSCNLTGVLYNINLTAYSSNILVGSQWHDGRCYADHSFIDLREHTNVYYNIDSISAQYCTLSGLYNVMIIYQNPGTAHRKLVECTGYDPSTQKTWYFENYPTLPPVEITP